jgi:hypothetical protein
MCGVSLELDGHKGGLSPLVQRCTMLKDRVVDHLALTQLKSGQPNTMGILPLDKTTR